MAAKKQQCFPEAFEILSREFSNCKKTDNVNNLPQLVLFAEKAVKDGSVDVATQSIQLYLSMNPPSNQFLIRAYLCLSISNKPDSTAEIVKLQESLRYIVKAVNLAKKTSCYHFLVYNASVILWTVTRPFHVPQYYNLCTNSVHIVVKALDEISYNDCKWRLQLMRFLIKCQLNSNQKDDVIKTGMTALQMARKHVPEQLIPLYKQMFNDGINDIKITDKDTRGHPQLSVLSKIWKLQYIINRKPYLLSEAQAKLSKILAAITDNEITSTKSGQRSGSPPIKPLPLTALPLVLIEIGEFAMNYSLHQIVSTCLSHIQSIQEPELSVRRELLEIQLMSTDKELYTKQSIKLRCQCVERCRDLLLQCTRENITDEMERVCVVLWNISLPLLQPTLTNNIIKPFTIATSVLEQINSLMYGLHGSLHFELAKIFYRQDKTKLAEHHINKAISLDHNNNNKDCYLNLKQCLELKADIYSQHHDPLDKALASVEQIKASDITNTHGLYQLLLSVGDTIDNNNFTNILTKHQSPTTDNEQSIIDQDLYLQKLSDKAVQYSRYKERAKSYYETNSSDNIEKRFLILADIAKLARKYHHWDIGILASLYCIQYDNGQWSPPIVPPSKDNSEIKKMGSKVVTKRVGSNGSLSSMNTPDHISSLSLTPLPLPYSPININTERMLLIILAEIHCVLAECLVKTLDDEGILLGGVAVPPNDVTIDNELWINYSDWINTLSNDAHSSFVRCAELGTTLSEQWLITNATVYTWNYHIQQLQQKQLNHVEKPFRNLFQILKAQPVAMRDNSLICRISGILAGSLIQGSAPKPIDINTIKTGEPQKKRSAGGKRTGSRGSARSKRKGEDASRQVSPEAVPVLKEALEICEFAVECFMYTPLDIRRIVMENLVLVKQLLQQPINIKTILNETLHEDDLLIAHSQAIISTEMYRTTTDYCIYVFPNIPTVQEVHDLISSCNWKGHTRMQMELYTLLAQSAYIQQNYDGVLLCCTEALKLNPANSNNSGLMSTCSSLCGQCLLKTSEGNATKIKESLSYFEQSVKYSREAGSYDNIIQNCKHAWNALISLLDTTIDRIELKDIITNIITNILKLIGRNVEASIFSPTDEDYQIIKNMITVLINIYCDNREWDSGLECLDHFIKFAPKPLQRLLYEQKIYFKCNLGKNIDGEMIRFQEEPQHFIASLWFTCAQHSPNIDQQYIAYRNAIQVLQKCDDDYSDKSALLIHYIIQYSMWLHANNYPCDIVMEHLKWAVHLVIKDHTQSNVIQLDALLIIHVMMSLSCDNNVKEHLCILSVSYCLNIWKGIHTERQKQQQQQRMPTTWNDWLSYNLTSETCDLVTTQNSLASDNTTIDYTIPSCHTIRKPMMTMYYMGQLYNSLCHIGHHVMCIPVLFYQLLLAKNIIQDKLLTQLILLRLSDVYSVIVDVPTLPMEFYNKAANDGFIHIDQIARAQSVNVTSSHVTVASSHVIYDKGCVQDTWIKIADLLIKQGQFQTARDLLQTAGNISKRYSDTVSMTTIKLLTAKLASLEKKGEICVEKLMTLQKCISRVGDWIILLDTLCNIGLTNSDSRDIVIRIMNDLLLSNNESCDQHVKSCDQSYLKGVVQLRLLLLMSNTVNSELEKEISSNIQLLKSQCYYKLCIELLHCMIKLRLVKSCATTTSDLVMAVEYSREAINITQLQQTSLPCSSGVPVNKDFIRSQLLLCRILYEIHKQHVNTNNKILNNQQNKSSIQKVIDDFTKEPSVYDETLRIIESTAGDEATMLLTNILILVDKNKTLKAECLLYMGLFYYSISLDVSPDLPLQWTTLPKLADNKLYTSLSMIMRKQQAENDTVLELVSIDSLIRSCNFLIESVSVGLNTKQLDIVRTASLKLVEIFGCCDPLMTINYLALYQSCIASKHCREMLCTILNDPDCSRLSALLNQETILLQSLDGHMTTTADVNLKALQKDYEAYRRLNVSDKHLELVSSLHCDTRVVIIQHSDNMSTLYGGYLVPPQPPLVVKKGQPLPDKPALCPAVCSMTVCIDDLISIKDLADQYKKDIKTFLQNPSCVQSDEELLQTSFDDLISSMEAYLEGIIAMLTDALKKEDQSKELTIVLLIDKDLMVLPLESLSFLQEYKNLIVNVSRDLSLQMMVHRMQCMKESDGNDEDTKKKSDKYQPQPVSLPVNISSIKYMLDPRNDLKLQIVDNVKKVIQDFSKVTNKWSGLTGTNQIISSGEWFSLITSSSGLLIVCSENVLSHYSPRRLASTNLPNCGVAIIQDKMSSSDSYLIQSKLDSVKSVENLSLEETSNAVKLLLLVGLNCVVINQWYSSIEDGSTDPEDILKELLSKPTKTGQIHWNSSDTSKTSYKTFNRVVYGLPHLTFITNN